MSEKTVIIQKGYIKAGFTRKDDQGNIIEREEGGWINDINGSLLAVGIEDEQFEIIFEDDMRGLYETAMKHFK